MCRVLTYTHNAMTWLLLQWGSGWTFRKPFTQGAATAYEPIGVFSPFCCLVFFYVHFTAPHQIQVLMRSWRLRIRTQIQVSLKISTYHCYYMTSVAINRLGTFRQHPNFVTYFKDLIVTIFVCYTCVFIKSPTHGLVYQ